MPLPTPWLIKKHAKLQAMIKYLPGRAQNLSPGELRVVATLEVAARAIAIELANRQPECVVKPPE